MKKTISIILCSVFVLFFAACGIKEESQTSGNTVESQNKVNIEALKGKYPEYFNLSGFKGIEVYVWQMAENSYRCGLMEGTNRNKTDDEITALQFKSLSIEEAKVILDEIDAEKESIIVYPIVQPYSSYYYEIDDEYRQRVTGLFE